MRLYLDTADPDSVRERATVGSIDGVTTNPSLVAGSDSDYQSLVERLGDVINGPVFAQVLAEDTEGIVSEAHAYDSWDAKVIVKIPASEAGFAALPRVREAGISAGITVVFSVGQAVLAARNGATFVAPYVGRLFDAGEDGLAVVNRIQRIIDEYGYGTEVLAASVRSLEQAVSLYEAGVDAVTLDPEVFDAHLHHPKTDEGIAGFLADWGDRGSPVRTDE